MSEIADELERLAVEFEEKAECAEAARVKCVAASPSTETASVYWEGQDAAYRDSSARLRERAAELRAQRSGPAYKPQPKPSETKVGQWWSALDENGAATDPFKLRGRPPRFLSDTEDMSGVFLEDGKIDAFDSHELLNSPNFVYLGDGPEPAR